MRRGEIWVAGRILVRGDVFCATLRILMCRGEIWVAGRDLERRRVFGAAGYILVRRVVFWVAGRILVCRGPYRGERYYIWRNVGVDPSLPYDIATPQVGRELLGAASSAPMVALRGVVYNWSSNGPCGCEG